MTPLARMGVARKKVSRMDKRLKENEPYLRFNEDSVVFGFRNEQCECPEKPTGWIVNGTTWECPKCHKEYVAFVEFDDNVGAVAYWHSKEGGNR